MPSVDCVEVFRASLKRCLDEANFLLDFYGTFMGSSEEVREKFRHTDLKRQTEVLADSLWAMAVVVQGQPGSPARRISNVWRSSTAGGISTSGPASTISGSTAWSPRARRHDPRFSAEIEQAWRETLAVGIELLRSGY